MSAAAAPTELMKRTCMDLNRFSVCEMLADFIFSVGAAANVRTGTEIDRLASRNKKNLMPKGFESTVEVSRSSERSEAEGTQPPTTGSTACR